MYHTTTSVATYATRLRAKLDPKHPCNKSFNAPGFNAPSDEVVEQQYQEKLLAGYKLYTGSRTQRRKNVCETCFQVRTATGSCNCY